MVNANKKELSGESSKPIKADKPQTVKKMKTVKISGNVEYARVPTRVGEFHRTTKNGAIDTSYEFRDGWVIFRAKVTPDVKTPERFFPGTSLGKIGALKALEKLETVAVGRALAFAGYLSDGEIASSEEMEKYDEIPAVNDPSQAVARLQACKTVDELKGVWLSLTQAERDTEEIAFTKEETKVNLETIIIDNADEIV